MAGKKGKIFGGISQILGFAVAGVAAIALGYFMGNLVIDYMMSGSPQEVQTDIADLDIDSPMDQIAAQVSADDQPDAAPKPAPAAGQAQGSAQKSQDESTPRSDASGSSPASNLYRVQVGAFNSRESAEKLAEKLKGEGYPVFVTATVPYRVQVGAFANRNNAVALSSELGEKGYETFITQ